MGMSQEVFVEQHRASWEEFERLLEQFEDGEDPESVGEFPRMYRTVCRHLSVARSRGYPPSVRDRLERLVRRGHTLLYRNRRQGKAGRIWAYVAGGFARDVRENRRFLVAALAALAVPFVLAMAWVMARPEIAVEILGPNYVLQLEQMYGTDFPARDATHDLQMFAYYIANNIGIALRTFGGGIIFGIGSLFILLFNGVFLGAASGYVTAAGYSEQFWPFVIGHGSFELTAIVVAGMAGLKIGAAPIWPGRRGRIDALRRAARDSVGLICGFVVMLVIAAFIEAFWSPRDVEPMVRYAVGAGLWAVVLGYFALAGRGDGSG